MKSSIVLLAFTLTSVVGIAQVSERFNRGELGIGFNSKLNTSPQVGLPKTSFFLGYRREIKYVRYEAINFISGVQGWLPRQGEDQVTLLKDQGIVENSFLPSTLLVGYLEGHFALKYTFKTKGNLKPYAGMGIGVVVAPFQETLDDYSEIPDGYSLPEFYNDNRSFTMTINTAES
ncbi:MAG: hypothetical protein NXI10_13960 [bacterium]|nr:hypothetical protein [bacterium]